MAEIFMAMFGRVSNQIVDFYLANQGVLNTIVVIYGLVLAIAHRNLQIIEANLLEKYRVQEWSDILDAVARTNAAETERWVRGLVRPPFIASPYFFSLYRITIRNIITVLGKKHTVPRSRLYEILSHTHRGEVDQGEVK